MEILLTLILWCLLLGSVVGFMAGLLGIGGGMIAVPALTYLLHYYLAIPTTEAITIAIGTSLSTIILTGMSSARTHWKLGNIKMDLAIYAGLGNIFGASIGAQIAAHMPGFWLKTLFGLFMLLLALYMLFGERVVSSKSLSKRKLVLISLVIGSVSAMMGVGGGALLVPALIYYQVAMKPAIGTASLAGVLIAIFGCLNYVQAGYGLATLPPYSIGYVYLPAALAIVCISIFTAPLGAKFVQKVDTKKLKRYFAIFQMAVAFKILMDLI